MTALKKSKRSIQSKHRLRKRLLARLYERGAPVMSKIVNPKAGEDMLSVLLRSSRSLCFGGIV